MINHTDIASVVLKIKCAQMHTNAQKSTMSVNRSEFEVIKIVGCKQIASAMKRYYEANKK